ncbi:hypothetical protein MUN81_02305 [Hymenobacter sp. 5317J-9]|uniref:hypothetical protein n=1 Tax=Hymenobacter sp. 5317J-9 TaxID=2932250 RepID=UPI001FD6423A|nr:hypothetical protein [Hymenobacter sp. 5317J-9]UOQ98330.1 hypothetical protein MUN81_02305 [Hymenobacter sp. 5317J-9]
MHALLRYSKSRWVGSLLALALATAACQSHPDEAQRASLPPVGHYEGSLSQAGRPDVRAALDIRHPSPGHYEAEFTAPGAPALNFVADSIYFGQGRLLLKRPLRAGQTLTLTLDGDFWRGTLALDSAKATAILLKRGVPSPSTYRVEELPQDNGSAWLYAPADAGTMGPALALLPDSATAAAACLWGDALAREGVIVLVLPPASQTTAEAEAPRVREALRFLRSTPGADTAHVGAWAAGARAVAVAQALAAPAGARPAYLIAQNASVDAAARVAFRELRNRKLPVLGLYGGPKGAAQANLLRNAMGGRRGAAVRVYRTAGVDLLVPGQPSAGLGPGLPGEVLEWVRGQ